MFSQGSREFVRVQTARAAGDNSYLASYTFSLHAKLYTKHSQQTLELMFNVLTKFGVTPVYCYQQCCEDCNWTRCKRYGRVFQGQLGRSCPLSEEVVRTALILTSNEHSVMFRTTTNGDLCGILRSLSLFSITRAKKMAANINVTERHTVPVLCNITSSTVI